MAKIRSIKPELWDDEKIGKMTRDCRLLFIGLLSFADDGGVIKSNATFIKNRVFPYDEDLRVADVTGWLLTLVESGRIIPFLYNNEGYYVIRTFCNHQIIDKRYERHLVPMDFVLNVITHVATTGSHSDNMVDTPQEGKGKEGKGREGECAPDLQQSKPVPTKAQTAHPIHQGLLPKKPSLEDVIRFFRGAGGTEEMAVKFWNAKEGVGWMNRGSPITNWTSMANNFIVNYQENEKKHGSGRKPSTATSIQTIDSITSDLIRDMDAAACERNKDKGPSSPNLSG